MGTSGNPAKRAAAKKASPSNISAFKKRSEGVLLPLPSGLTVKAKRVELQAFIHRGSVPNPLMEIVSEALNKGKKADIPAMMGVDEGKIDLDMVQDMYEMVDGIVVASVIQPPVNPLPEDPADRDGDLLYVDEIDDEDKMFIYQWAIGGTGDVETFRRESRADMDALAEIQGAGAKAE